MEHYNKKLSEICTFRPSREKTAHKDQEINQNFENRQEGYLSIKKVKQDMIRNEMEIIENATFKPKINTTSKRIIFEKGEDDLNLDEKCRKRSEAV